MSSKEQTVVEHLTEFRWRFIVVLIWFGLIFLVSLLFAADIYKWLTASFEQKLIVLGPDDILWIYISFLDWGLCRPYTAHYTLSPMENVRLR